MPTQKGLTLKEAKIKACSFCAYRERTQQEVREKLYGYGLWSEAVEEVIAYLITEGFINEERFAKAYAGGKFRINHWGRIKITRGLQAKGLSRYCIEAGLNEIPNDEYYQKIDYLIEKKMKTYKNGGPYVIKNKLAQFLIIKGYEVEIVWEVINQHGFEFR